MTSNLIATADESTPYEKANDATEELPHVKQTGQFGGLGANKDKPSSSKPSSSKDSSKDSTSKSSTERQGSEGKSSDKARAAQGYTAENEMREDIGA